MKILLVHPHKISTEIPLGLLYLSSKVKLQGHEVRLFYGNLCNQQVPEYYPSPTEMKRSFIRMLDDFQPDLVGLSVMSTAFYDCLELSHLAKKKGCLVIWGGPHPTIDPEFCILQDAVDMLCVGEGEDAFSELVDKLEEDRDITTTENIWVKANRKVYRNPVRSLIGDLDELPWPDRGLLDPVLLDLRVRGANFITGRGCPYKCSYCINHQLQTLYKGKGHFVRYRSFKSVIEEIKTVVTRNNSKEIVFSDEIIGLDKRRLIEFCKVYSEEVKISFICQIRANIVDDEVAVALKEAGCRGVSVGIESGNDRIRKEILNRKMSRETITGAFQVLREVGVRAGAFNMIGMPTETEETIWDTIELNRQIDPDGFMHLTILMPFKGTKIRETMELEGLIKKEASTSYYSDIMQELPGLSKSRLISYRHLFGLYVYSDKRYFFLINLLKVLWSLVPTDDNVNFPERMIRSLAWRLTALARKLLIPKGRAGTGVSSP